MSVSPKRAHVFWWKDLERWIVPALQHSAKLPDGWSLVRVGDVVKQVTDKVKVKPDNEYKLAGVRWYGEGVFHRETVTGSNSSATYLMPLIPGSFIYNRLFAWKESFAIVQEELNDCLVSNEFPQFRVNSERLLVRYLYLFFMCNSTIKDVNKASIGSAAVSRNRYKEEYFLNVQIPLPPLSTQRAIANRWQQTETDKNVVIQRIKANRESLEISLLQKIGINIGSSSSRGRAFKMHWNKLERWDLFYYRADFVSLQADLESLKSKRLGEIANFITRPWSAENFEGEYFRYIEISSVDKKQGITGTRLVNVCNAPSRATTLVKSGDLLISMTRPYLGGFAKVTDDYDNCVCTSGFSVIGTVNESLIDKYFLLFFLKSPAGLKQMERRMTGGLYPAIVQSELENILVPLIPLEQQKEFVKKEKLINAQITEDLSNLDKRFKQSKIEIEAMILGTKKVDQP